MQDRPLNRRRRTRGSVCGVAEQSLFGEAILRGRECGRRRQHGRLRLDGSQAFRRDIFPVERDDIDFARKLRQQCDVVELAGQNRRNLRGRGVGTAIDELEPEPQGKTGQGQHASKLAGTDDADSHPAGAVERRGSPAFSTSCVWALAESLERLIDLGMLVGEDGSSQQSGIRRPGAADRDRRHRHARRHLHDREQGVETAQGLRLDRDAEHRKSGLCGRHAGEMCRATRAGDDHFEAALLRGARVLEQQVGRAMRRHDTHFMCYAEPLENFRCRTHRLPVGGGAHDDADQRFHAGIVARTPAATADERAHPADESRISRR